MNLKHNFAFEKGKFEEQIGPETLISYCWALCFILHHWKSQPFTPNLNKLSYWMLWNKTVMLYILSGLQWDAFTKHTPFTHSLISFNRLSLIRKQSDARQAIHWSLTQSNTESANSQKNHVLVQKITIYMVIISKASTEVGPVHDFIIKTIQFHGYCKNILFLNASFHYWKTHDSFLLCYVTLSLINRILKLSGICKILNQETPFWQI